MGDDLATKLRELSAVNVGPAAVTLERGANAAEQLVIARKLLADASALTWDKLIKGPIDEFLSVPMP